MDFDFSYSALMSSFIFGVIGLYLFRAGKKMTNYVWMAIAVALMVYPMLVHGWFLDWGIGIALCAVAYYVR
jgi:hypothetical protein